MSDFIHMIICGVIVLILFAGLCGLAYWLSTANEPQYERERIEFEKTLAPEEIDAYASDLAWLGRSGAIRNVKRNREERATRERLRRPWGS